MAKQKSKRQNEIARQMILRTGNHAGKHQNREYDVKKGRKRSPKHKKSPRDSGAFDVSILLA